MDSNVDQLKEEEEPVTNLEEKDRVKLLSIFQQEVWTKILKRVEEPETLQSLWNTSPFFRTRISQNPSQFLFPKVWPLVREHFEKAAVSNRVNTVEGEEEVPIPIEKQMLNLRKVCRTWSTGLDNYYAGSRNKLDKTQQDEGSSAGPWTVQNLQNSHRLQKFLDHFEESHENRNPFLGRSVALLSNWSTGHETDLLWSLLEKYGHHIWYCQISLGGTNLRRFYNRLQRMLSLLPNVKSLQLHPFVIPCQKLFVNPEGYREPTTRMPALSNLTEVSLTALPDLVVREILMASGVTLHSLKIYRGRLNLNRSYQALYEVAMPNLKLFKWRINTEQDFEMMENSEIHWPVEALRLEFGTYIQLSRILNLLKNHWAQTLTTLSLVIWKPREEEALKLLQMESLTLELELPKLRYLHLKLGNCIVSLDFLIGVKDSLETLNVEWCQDEDSVFPEEKKVKFWSYLGSVQESDIWSLFPKLRKIFTTKTIRGRRKVTGVFCRGQRGSNQIV